MFRIVASGLVAAGVLVGSMAPAEASPLVDKADRRGDVSVHHADGVDRAVLESIDLRHVTITRQGGSVRVVIRLKKVLPSGRFFQQVGISLIPPSGWVGPSWLFLASATPQHLGSAGAVYLNDISGEDEEDEEEPTICHLAASKGAKMVRMVIPNKCLPPDGGRLFVSSALIDKKGNDPFLAEDDLGAGQVDLQPGRMR